MTFKIYIIAINYNVIDTTPLPNYITGKYQWTVACFQ